MMNAIGYVRVSTEEQGKKGISLDTQRDSIKKYCLDHELRLLRIFEDQKTGTNTNRPGFQKAIAAVETRKAERLVVYKHDRLFREAWRSIEMGTRLGKRGILIISTTESISNDFEDKPEELLTYGVNSIISDYNARVIGKRTKDALRYLRESGRAYGPTPFGMKLVADKHGVKYLKTNYQEQTVLREILTLRMVNKMSFRGIATTLNKLGMTPRPKLRNGKLTSGLWSGETIKYTLFRIFRDQKKESKDGKD